MLCNMNGPDPATRRDDILRHVPCMEDIFKVNLGRAKMEFARIHMKNTQNSEMNTLLFSFLMLSLTLSASSFRDESSFKLRRIFLSPFLAPCMNADFSAVSTLGQAVGVGT